MSGRFSEYKNRGRSDESARGKRREFVVSLRKDQRNEKVGLGETRNANDWGH